MAVKLGELLVKAKLITPDNLNEALKEQKSSGAKLGEVLVKMGLVSEEDITRPSRAVRRPVDQPHALRDRPERLKLVPADVARNTTSSRSTRPAPR